jgi:hypothetical protein
MSRCGAKRVMAVGLGIAFIVVACGGSVEDRQNPTGGSGGAGGAGGAGGVGGSGANGQGGTVALPTRDASVDSWGAADAEPNIPPCPEQVVFVAVDDAADFCSVPMPPMPEPWERVPDHVNVVIEAEAGKIILYYVNSTEQCAEAAAQGGAGWFYDDRDAPTQITFCPEACQIIASGGGGGLATVLQGCGHPWPPN